MKVTFGQQTTKVKQLADLLSQEISMGKYRSDCTLPSINKLSRDYQVSRDTVFKAFIDLKDRGIIDSTTLPTSLQTFCFCWTSILPLNTRYIIVLSKNYPSTTK